MAETTDFPDTMKCTTPSDLGKQGQFVSDHSSVRMQNYGVIPEKGSSSCGGKKQVDDECDKMETWCWPCPPKPFSGPCKYDKDTLCKIPTGSLYFASRKGPLSELNARITHSPYDMVGIVFQSTAKGKEGTYIYTVDSTFIDGDKITNKAAIVDLSCLMSDDSIIYHAVLPLKDFDDANSHCDHSSSKGSEDYDKKKCTDSKGSGSGKKSKRRHRGPICHKEDSNSSDFYDSSWSDDEDCYEEFYTDCSDGKNWKSKMREKRNEVLKYLFRKYRNMRPEHDAYQSLASIIGLPVAEQLRTKNAFTAPEMIGLILFQAGLIWDDRFASGNQNPACCFDKDFFYQLAKDCASVNNETEAIVALTTPKSYANVQYADKLTHCEQKEVYPHLEYDKRCDTCGKETESPKIKKKCKKLDHSHHKDKQWDFKQEWHQWNQKDDHKDRHWDSSDGKHDDKYKHDSSDGKHDDKYKHDSSDGKHDDSGHKERKRYTFRYKADAGMSEKQIHDNLSKYLEDAFRQGWNCEYKDAYNGEKGGSYDGNGYCDYFKCDDDYTYQRCYKPGKWCKPSDCYDHRYGFYPKPCKRDIHARTILFGSLRVVDFLTDYYKASGINTHCPVDYSDLKCSFGGATSEVVSTIHSLTNQCNGDVLDCNSNKLNMSWYHDNLIPIKLCNNPDEDCDDRIEKECNVLKKLVCKLNRNFIQKKMLHQDNSCLSGNRLLQICARLSQLSSELHAIACDSDTYVQYGEKDCAVKDWYDFDDEDKCGDCKFKLNVTYKDPCVSEYVLVLHKYMWGCGWNYYWRSHLSCKPQKYYDLCCRIQRIIKELRDLKNRTPVTCILLELIVRLSEQAESLWKYLCKCRAFCCGWRKDKRDYTYSYHKGGDVAADELISNLAGDDSSKDC